MKRMIDEFIEYAETAFGVRVIVRESKERSDSCESLFGGLPEESDVGEYKDDKFEGNYGLTQFYSVSSLCEDIGLAA